jgi:hypothetical protein
VARSRARLSRLRASYVITGVYVQILLFNDMVLSGDPEVDWWVDIDWLRIEDAS